MGGTCFQVFYQESLAFTYPNSPNLELLTFDVDGFDDPAHGEQQLVLFHGYYDQYQYLPRVITCAETTWW